MAAGPYPQAAVVERIEQRAALKGLNGKGIANLLGAEPQWWTRRRQCKTPITLPELSILAVALAEESPMPPGWPLLDDYHQRALQVGLAKLAEDALKGPSSASPHSARPEGRRTKGQSR